MKKLGIIFAVILVAIGLQELGVWSNHVVMARNSVCALAESPLGPLRVCGIPSMPVWEVNDGIARVDKDDFPLHQPLTKQTALKPLADILPTPIFHGFNMGTDVSSIGDLCLTVGGLAWLSLPVFPLFWLVRWVWRTK